MFEDMKTILAITLLAAAAYAQTTETTVKSLAWITGCWETTDSRGRTTTERWAAPTENLMLGTSQTVKDGKSTSFEFLRVMSGPSGIAYVAKPSSASSETTFTFAKGAAKEVVFENLKHDFPQRIIYRQPTADTLSARIEGTMNGELRGMDIPMKRVKCE